ncbi:hypothetical protein ElyMa_000162000 [Elysia marginata]|uniref:Uncharacterized protein n=1 Tax=Elysia marginata TaxID=1093978 RepID=A0AAV4ESA9_9GAST|nr:hypothetical protein ElyMa_000162000 [Elysia marginata]
MHTEIEGELARLRSYKVKTLDELDDLELVYQRAKSGLNKKIDVTDEKIYELESRYAPKLNFDNEGGGGDADADDDDDDDDDGNANCNDDDEEEEENDYDGGGDDDDGDDESGGDDDDGDGIDDGGDDDVMMMID